MTTIQVTIAFDVHDPSMASLKDDTNDVLEWFIEYMFGVNMYAGHVDKETAARFPSLVTGEEPSCNITTLDHASNQASVTVEYDTVFDAKSFVKEFSDAFNHWSLNFVGEDTWRGEVGYTPRIVSIPRID